MDFYYEEITMKEYNWFPHDKYGEGVLYVRMLIEYLFRNFRLEITQGLRDGYATASGPGVNQGSRDQNWGGPAKVWDMKNNLFLFKKKKNK